MATKVELYKRNRDLRKQMLAKLLQNKKKEMEKAQNAVAKEKERLHKEEASPEMISTINKRLKRIDPINSVAGLNPYDCAIVCFYKLKQFGAEDVRIYANASHAWAEFYYDDKWWIFDPVAVRRRKLGIPVKRKVDAELPEYTSMSIQYKTVSKFMEAFDSRCTMEIDEYKIYAMEEEGLQGALKINYH